MNKNPGMHALLPCIVDTVFWRSTPLTTIARHRWRQNIMATCIVVASTFAAFPVAAGPYYVAPSGSDNNPGTISMPLQTVNRGVQALQPGETLYMRSGVYPESLIWNIPSGTPESPVTIAAYPGESVTLRPHSGARVVEFWNQRNIILDGLVLDGANVRHNVVKFYQPAESITIQNSEIRHSPEHGILGAGSNVLFSNIALHNTGAIDDYPPGYTAMYWQGNNTIVEHSKVYNNNGSGISFWVSATGSEALPIGNNIARYNDIYDNHRISSGAVSDRHDGVGLFCGSQSWPTSCTLHDNVLTNNDIGINLWDNVTHAEVFNNTISGGTSACIWAYDGASAAIHDNTCQDNTYGIIAKMDSVGLASNLVDNDPPIINPEPTSLLLIGSGFAWLIGRRRQHNT